MDDKSTPLNLLRIDRASESAPSGKRWGWLAAAAAGSILDASGYVVARRQATVASKITAKMVELNQGI